MDRARWEKVIELYHAASEREPARRNAFLANACEGDDELRSEVESLLRQDLSKGDMLERIAEDNRNWSPAAKLHSRPMTLSVGTRLAHYEILALLGAGGMGEVYRARDLKLKREVAIKILPEEFSRDRDRVSRFQREAEVLASLNHANIAIIHDVQEANETRFLVLELVEGETLAERIQHGPISVDEALKIGGHICEALEAAHGRGIIHRDLKPANVKITPDGKVKVLDFGLAKAMPEEPADRNFSDSPTISNATSAGVILGTAVYMSPEQVRGKSVDKRADIWAFGVLLYEMITGRPPFQGTDISEILASVIKDNPDYEVIPPAVRRLIKKCLEKDPARRLRDIGDAWELLETPSSGSGQAEVLPTPARLRWAGWVAAALLAFFAGWLYFHQPIPPSPSIAKLEWDLPLNGTAMELSPDGKLLSFGSPDRGIWIRPLNSNAAHVLPGTEKYSGSWFWSPDSRFIAFSQDNKLKKIDVTGGPPSTVLDALVGGASRGGSWNPDGVLLLGSATGIQRASLAGGAITNATTVDKSKELDHLSPVFLPDGKHFIYVRTNVNRQSAAVYLGSIDEKPEQQSLKPLIASTQYGTNDGHVYYVSTGKDDPNIGYIVYKRDNTVLAQAFNAKTFILSAEPVPLSDATAWFFTAAPNVLAHNTGTNRGGVPLGQLTWYDRATKEPQPLGDPAVQFSLNLSPDGSRVAVERALSPSRFRAVWVIDSRPYRETKLTEYELTACCGVWSPDGSEIIFTARVDRQTEPAEGLVPTGLYRMSSNGAGQPKLLLKGPHHSLSWSREGILMLTTYADSTDLWTLDLGKDDAKPVPYLNSPSSEIQGQFSPDGRWVAYTSNESGKNEVYVRSFPDPSRSKTPISSDGGSMPRWSRDGRELFYFAADDMLTSVAVTLGAQFKMHERKPVFTVRPARRALDRAGTALSWDVAPDGRFLINTSVNPDEALPTSVVLNWQSLFKK